VREIDLDTIQEKIRSDLSFTADEMLWLDEAVKRLRGEDTEIERLRKQVEAERCRAALLRNELDLQIRENKRLRVQLKDAGLDAQEAADHADWAAQEDRADWEADR